jgi:poly(3-hydroxybutyrate) depolymerase
MLNINSMIESNPLMSQFPLNFIKPKLHKSFNNNHGLYSVTEALHNSFVPTRILNHVCDMFYSNPMNPMHYTKFGRLMKSFHEMSDRMMKTYMPKPFGFHNAGDSHHHIHVKEEVLISKPFCNLLHFSKNPSQSQPKILLVAPMAGHFATLLRGTVKDMLPYFDVYITDWKNASDIPLSMGEFTVDTYIDYLIEFIEFLHGDLNVMAICQPTVPVLATVSYMSEKKSKKLPASMILVSGPIDTRVNQTEVNKFALSKNMEWFEENLISIVPGNYKGAGRKIYPGFLQLIGFMSLNLAKHTSSHINMFFNIYDNKIADLHKQQKFYDEYLTVMDLPAEYYLQTIKDVFLSSALGEGKFLYKGHLVKPSKITNVRLLVLEAEKDDISGVGQTLAAINLCSSLNPNDKMYYVQKGVGHYGVFNSSKFKECVIPVIKDFIYKN